MTSNPRDTAEKDVPRMPRGPQRRKRRECPSCHRGNAVRIVVNPGTVSSVCRWCGRESTTVLADLTRPLPSGVDQP